MASAKEEDYLYDEGDYDNDLDGESLPDVNEN